MGDTGGPQLMPVIVPQRPVGDRQVCCLWMLHADIHEAMDVMDREWWDAGQLQGSWCPGISLSSCYVWDIAPEPVPYRVHELIVQIL